MPSERSTCSPWRIGILARRWARRALRCWLSVIPSERSSRTEREGRTRSTSSLACLASRRYSSRGRRSWTGAAWAGSNGSSPCSSSISSSDGMKGAPMEGRTRSIRPSSAATPDMLSLAPRVKGMTYRERTMRTPQNKSSTPATMAIAQAADLTTVGRGAPG